MEELSEKEQLDVIRQWWRENGNFVITGIVLGIILLVGWNQWRGGIVDAQLEASALYETLVSHVADGELEEAEAVAATLFAEYASTTYPGHARLAMARLYMDKGRDSDAAAVLSDLLDSGAAEQVRHIGRLRLAKVLLYQEKLQEVVDLLSGTTSSSYLARYNEILGDAYAALERYDDAADAYAIAMAEDPQSATVDLTLVQMKINDLPEEGVSLAIDESLDLPGDESDEETPAEPQETQP